MARLTKAGLFISNISRLIGRFIAIKMKNYQLEELNVSQARVLFYLSQQNNVPIQTLVKHTSLGKSSLTAILDVLEEGGYIQRIPDKNDRRKTLIRLIKIDLPILKIYQQILLEISEVMYQGFTKEEIKVFETYLEKIMTNLMTFIKGQ